METLVHIGVYRRLDNRKEGLDDDSPRALELHHLRHDALHAALGSESDLRVQDWGETDDLRSHEYVELVVSSAASAFHYLAVPALIWLGRKLAEKLVDETVSEFVKSLIARLKSQQEAGKIQDFHLQLPDGTSIRVDPPFMGGKLSVFFRDGSVQSVEYTADTED